jgi:hypothetical protein
MATDEHISVVVEVTQVSNECISFRMRCCNDPSTDSWHTISVMTTDPDDGNSIRARTDDEFHTELAGHCLNSQVRHASIQHASDLAAAFSAGIPDAVAQVAAVVEAKKAAKATMDSMVSAMPSDKKAK